MNCANCDKELRILEGKKISGGSRICKNCLSKLSIMIKDYLPHMSAYDVAKAIEYVGKANNEWQRLFVETGSYGIVHIDEIHGLFAICNKKVLDADTQDIYHVLNIESISIDMIPDEKQPKHNKVCGHVRLRAALKEPNIVINTVIKEKVRAEMQRIDREHIGWAEPSELASFKMLFEDMIKNVFSDYKRAEEEKNLKQGQQDENVMKADKNDMELIKAMATFMIEEGYTKEELRKQRNLLMKTFHTDGNQVTSSKYVQKINHYYDVLLRHLDKK